MAQGRRQRDTGQQGAAGAGAAGSSEDDNGEGCSYSWADARDVYSSNVAAGPLNSEEACWCETSVASTLRQRKRRGKCSVSSRTASLALLAASIPFLPLAQAVPFEKGSSDTTEKGKGRAAIDLGDYGDRYTYADIATYHHQSSNKLADIFSSSLDAGYSEKPAHRVIRSKRGPAAAKPPGPAALLPGHYVYVDGQWVPSTDWSLNGREGAQDASPVTSNSPSEGVASGQGVDESLLQPQISIDSGEDSSALEANPDDNLDEDSLGWAPTTNAMLGVDLEATRTVSSTPTSSNTQTSLPTRTNMAQLSSASSSASAVTSASSSSSNSIVAYDFSHDVPNGWVNDGRTPAYAVPVIIGVSVVLAIIIFTLVLFFVRGARKRKRCRKYGMKLQEEGDMPTTRPTSPSSQDQGEGDEQDMSRGARAPNGEIVYDEKKKQRIISRRWSLAGGQQSLRKRRGKIANLLNRKGPIVEEVVPSSITSAHTRTSSHQTSPLRRRTLSQQSLDGERIGSATDGSYFAEAEQANDAHDAHTGDRSRSPVTASMARYASTISSSTSDAPLQPAPEAALLPTSSNSPRPPMLQLPQHATSPLQPTQDLYNVPVPVIGPPAYIHPPSPAYTSNSLDTPQAGYFADEKRALLNHTPAQSSSNIGASSSDPYRQQRRYEHLYASRDGEDAEREQRTGAPHAGPSSSAFAIQSEEGEEEENQQPMRAHIAVDDKGLLNRIREAASAPSQPPSSAEFATAPEARLNASAPPLASELDGDDEDEQALPAQTSTSHRSFLPAPPRPVATSLSAIPPLLDEKTRLRQAEEQQATYMLSPEQPSAPDFASSSAHEPSVPDFDGPYGSGQASAPPLDEEDEGASAPPLPEVVDDDDHHFSRRPYVEGIV